MIRLLSKRWKIIILVLVCLSISYLLHSLWLPFFGTFLVVDDHLEKSDVIIVLGTDLEGVREAWAAEIYKRGLAKKIIMCGYKVGWRTSTAEIMKKHALSLGIPEDAIILDYGLNTNGTWDNAKNSLKIIQENKFQSIILVSSNYHTTRSRYAFKKVFKNTDIKILISASPDSLFNPDKWWTSLRSVRILITEYTKLLYYLLVPPNLAIKIEF